MTTHDSVTIGDLITAGALVMSDGYRTKRSELAESGFRIIRVADVRNGAVSLDGPDHVSPRFTKAIGDKVGTPGDILLTTKGTVGRVAVMPTSDEACVYSPQLCFFRVLDDAHVDQRFLQYWFASPQFAHQAADRMNNTDMAAYINLADIRSLRLSLPDMPVQRKIAEVLRTLDDKIASNTQLARTAGDLAIAVCSRARELVPIGAIAEPMRDVVEPISISEERVWHFSLPAFDEGQRADHVEPQQIKSAKSLLKQPCLLVSKLNPRFPRIWDVPVLPAGLAIASTEFVAFETRVCSTSVLWALASQPGFRSTLQEQSTGTSGSHQRVRPADLMATLVGDPSSMPRATLDLVTALGRARWLAVQESGSLAATRDALLPPLMSGRLRVRDAEKIVGDRV